MKIEMFEKNLVDIEYEITASYSGLKRYKIYNFFKDVKELLEYRKIRPFVEISEDGHEFRCQRCGTYMNSFNTYDEFEFCPLCGQRVAEEGACHIIEEENG